MRALRRSVEGVRTKRECGQALIIVLVLLVLSTLMVTPLLSYMGTGLRTTSVVYEQKTNELYAADAGLVDAMWQIKYDHLGTLFGSDIPYHRYDYSTEWTYSLDEAVNEEGVAVSIRNVWIPKDLDVPSQAEAEEIVTSGKLMVLGGVNETSAYRIRINYHSEPGENLLLETVGVWLPDGFTYVPESSNLEADDTEPYYAVPTLTPHAGGQAVVWDMSEIAFDAMPGVDPSENPMTTTITFEFDSRRAGRVPDAVSWITTSGVSSIPYAWDADTRIFQIRSTAGGTLVESFTAKIQMRELAAATSGNYFATGNSLIGGNYSPPDNYHHQLHQSTSVTIETHDGDATQGIPGDAQVEAAYLYWTGWIDWNEYNPGYGTIVFQDDCSDFANWDNGSRWSIYETWYWYWVTEREFRGQGGGDVSGRTLTMSNSLDLSSFVPGTVTVSWDQRRYGTSLSSDALYYAFSGDGGSTWSTDFVAFQGTATPTSPFNATIPGEYLTDDFRMRFYFNFTNTSRYVYLDDITVRVGARSMRYPDDPTDENLKTLVEDTARVNRILFNDTVVEAEKYEVLHPAPFETAADYTGTWFYSAKADVTDLLHYWIESDVVESNAAGSYTFGHYHVGTNPNQDNYHQNSADPDYAFSFSDAPGSTGYPLGTPSPIPPGNVRYSAAHAGWSLIIIYSSSETYGH